MLKVTLLGTGTSGGVPALGCECDVCRSTDPKDKRLRSAAMIETESTRLLIDAGPDIRQQMLRVPFRKIDGLLITHKHYDHVGGIDDLRPFCKYGDINIYGDKGVTKSLPVTMPYCFPASSKELYPGAPKLQLHTIEPHHIYKIGDIEWMPVKVMHDKMPILGFRFGKFAYITDMKTIPDECNKPRLACESFEAYNGCFVPGNTCSRQSSERLGEEKCWSLSIFQKYIILGSLRRCAFSTILILP